MKAKREKDSERSIDAVNVVCATECTGILPALPQDGDTDVDARRLYGVPEPRKARAGRE